ncbi:MAG: DUF2793 domain-containing protein [Sphingopyxis sp.]|nr:DUF2793 domain-containing protein [Sphingopyxis sp.]
MSELLQSARWKLPLLAVGQLQKEVTHNEALALVDALIAPVAIASGVNDPPSAPLVGQIWLVGTAPTGVWTGFALHLACWTSGGWRMIAPRSGMTLRLDGGPILRFDGAAWLNPGQVYAPSGGGVVDSEARAAISALIEALQAHGWLEQI